MTKERQGRRRGSHSATDLNAELERVAAMTIDELRELWRQRRGQNPPEALSKGLIACALAHWRQEELIGGPDRHVRKLLASLAKIGAKPPRHLKIGSVIVREHQGGIHEVVVAPGGFYWQGRTYSSLSTIAKAITGTNWNGPRVFGLRDAEDANASGETAVAPSEVASVGAPKPNGRSPSKRAPARRPASIGAAGTPAREAVGRGGGL
jgi:Protein of unknown function (DUF2924)